MKRLVCILLCVCTLLSISACTKLEDDYEDYKSELIEELKNKLTGATQKETLIIWEAQEKLRNAVYDSEKSLGENKGALETIVEDAMERLSWERATLDDYVQSCLFRKDHAVSLVTDVEGGGYTSTTQLVFDWLISDTTVKKQLSEVKKIGEIFESATIFFLADGSFVMENHYAELMVVARKSFSTADEESLRTEVVYGSYQIGDIPDENGTYPITVTKEDGSTMEFRFTPKGGLVSGQQIFVNEIYERTENAVMPQKTIADYLTENGFLKKNSVEGAKIDYHTDLTAKAVLKGNGQNMTVGDIYTESVVSFTEGGKAVITNYYTELGESIRGVSEECLIGTYTVSKEAANGTKKHLIRVKAEDRTVDFYLDVVSGELTRNDLLEEEKFVPFTTAELLANSGAGYAEESWTDADGAILTDVVYGDEERNRMDVYIPSNFDPRNENGVIMFIHGGSWVGGGKEDMANLCKKYAKMGYFTVAISHSYAMSTQTDGSYTTFLTINQEIGKAFAMIKSLSDQNGWNITQAALSGYSSGCHLAYLYAYSDGNEADAPIPVKAVFGMVGCMDFRAEYWENVSTDGPGVAALGLNDARLTGVGESYGEEEYNAIMDKISPLSYAKNGDAVPSVFAYAMLDETLIDWYNGVALDEVLSAQNIPHEFYQLPNSGHVSGNNATITKRYQESVAQYLKTYFGY